MTPFKNPNAPFKLSLLSTLPPPTELAARLADRLELPRTVSDRPLLLNPLLIRLSPLVLEPPPPLLLLSELRRSRTYLGHVLVSTRYLMLAWAASKMDASNAGGMSPA